MYWVWELFIQPIRLWICHPLRSLLRKHIPGSDRSFRYLELHFLSSIYAHFELIPFWLVHNYILKFKFETNNCLLISQVFGFKCTKYTCSSLQDKALFCTAEIIFELVNVKTNQIAPSFLFWAWNDKIEDLINDNDPWVYFNKQ